MAKMAANSNPNQSFSSSFSPFIDDNKTLILQRQKKKPRLASWGSGSSGEEVLKELGDLRYNSNQPLAFSNSPFFHEQETLISQKNQKKPTLASWWWSVDESFNELGAIFNKAPPISSYSTAGVLKPPPEVIVIDDDENDEETLESSLTFNNTPPISSPSSPAVSKSPPGVIVIDDDDEEEIIAISNDNNPKLDSNGKKSPTIVDNEEDSGSVGIDSEKSSNNGGAGGFRHVTLDELGVTIEDLKRIPWEAFDPIREIKSVMLDPSLGWIYSTTL